ncbi:GAF domain-containing protein [Leptospira perolatii]|uniref:GAF domain-containing protein n=1 Tax=Leptospira perolatii TaxID=2023191 RepID=A0A2M9ZNH5_9LEPT|nr:GAF domain-containing protein [Leptospira perolatii]PJZ68693.1 GAF domain-containing protein [Leptospira perolatii]PJZ73529.1 GAF domain-containing protein [Leptospira perolatii]
MGLLDKVTRMIRSGEIAPASSAGSSQTSTAEKPSLLKKSLSFSGKSLLRKAQEFRGGNGEKSSSKSSTQAPISAQESPSMDFGREEPEFRSAFGDPAEFEPSPMTATEESISSEMEGPPPFSMEDSDFELPAEESAEFPASEDFGEDFGTEQQEPIDLSSLDLSGPEEPESAISDFGSDLPELEDFGEDTESDLGDFGEEPSNLAKPSSIQDPFSDWVKEAEANANKSAAKGLRPEQKEGSGSDYLFDDESDYSTLPIDLQIASRKKLENYLSAFEIAKEIASSTDFANFFENLCFSIQGQIGCESIVVFSSTSESFEALRVVEAQGISADPEWVLESGDETYQAALRAPSVIYAKEMFKFSLPKKEKIILEKTNAELIVPIRNVQEFFGLFVLSKTVEGDDYTIEDLEFLKIVGEVAGSVFRRIRDIELVNQENENLKEVLKNNELILTAARELAQVRDLDEAYDRFTDIFKRELGVRRWSLLLLEGTSRKEYKVFGTNLLTPETVGKFRLGLDSKLVGIVANVSGVFRIANFRKNPELLEQITNDELGLMREFDILPLLNLNWLVGMMVIHETEAPWTDTDRETAVGISEVSAPVISNLLMLEQRDAVFRDPFSPVELRINEAIQKVGELGTAFSLTVFKVQNASRMVRLKGAGFFSFYCEELRLSIQDNLGESDYCYRVGQGKYVVVLDGKDREETQIVVRKIRNRITEIDRHSKDFQTGTTSQTLCYPSDTKEKERLLDLIEES